MILQHYVVPETVRRARSCAHCGDVQPEHRLQGRRQHFLYECRAHSSLTQMLPTATPVDPACLDISAQRERFKLCFANG